jgi:SNF2 family DNA or RNA helicase
MRWGYVYTILRCYIHLTNLLLYISLGKTVQVVNFIGALIKYKKAKYFLLTLPKMVLPQWKKCFFFLLFFKLKFRFLISYREFYKWQSKLCIFDATQPNVSISLFLSSNEYAIVLVTYGFNKLNVYHRMINFNNLF